jgi:hypothetical protein
MPPGIPEGIPMADDEQSDKVGPWTVKGIPPDVRVEITRAAKRADQTVGEWLQGAVRLAIQAERQGPPARPPEDDRPQPAPAPVLNLASALEVVERLTAVLPGLTGDDGRLAEAARKVIRQNLAALDLASRPPRSPPKSLPRPAAPPPE